MAVLATAGLAVGAPVALAGTAPVQQGYSTPGGVVQTQVESGTAPAPDNETVSTPAAAVETRPASGSELPFTGLDVALVLAAGAMLVAGGFGLRRLSRAPGAV